MIWDFIQNQILGMKWLNVFIGKGLSNLGLDIGSRVGGSIHFFLYDTVKITVLLCFLIFSSATFKAISRQSGARKSLDGFMGFGQTAFRPCWVR